MGVSNEDPETDTVELTATAAAETPPTSTAGPPSPSSSLARTVSAIVVWYCLSNAIILYTKWIFKNYFPYPLTVTTIYNATSSLWAILLSHHRKLRTQCYSEPLTKKQFTHYVLPIGILTAIEISCSNFALKLLTVSFGTILKGLAPLFTFCWGLVFGLETFSLKISACLFTMAFGIFLASMGEGHEFELWGFLLQLFSTCLGGLRWAVTHKLLLEDEGDGHEGRNNNNQHQHNHRMSPLKAILYTAPTMTLSVLPVALIDEGTKVWNHEVEDGMLETSLVFTSMLVVATMVFLLIMSEYWLVGATSSLALSVAAVFKELLTIGGGILLFAEHVDFLNVIGFTICQMGIMSYVFLRYDRSVAYTPIEGEGGGNNALQQPGRQDGENGRLPHHSTDSYNNAAARDAASDSEEVFEDEIKESHNFSQMRHRNGGQT